MYLSDRDLSWAIECGKLIVDPKPEKIDSTSIDLHLDAADQAKVWDVQRYADDQKTSGHDPHELPIGKFEYEKFAPKYLVQPPTDRTKPVYRRGGEIVIKSGLSLKWWIVRHRGSPIARPVSRPQMIWEE